MAETTISRIRLPWGIILRIWMLFALGYGFFSSLLAFAISLVFPSFMTFNAPFGIAIAQLLKGFVVTFLILKLTLELRWPLMMTIFLPHSQVKIASNQFLGCLPWRNAAYLWFSFIWRFILFTTSVNLLLVTVESYIQNDLPTSYAFVSLGISTIAGSIFALRRCLDSHQLYLFSMMNNQD
jgi:hypothetical protein